PPPPLPPKAPRPALPATEATNLPGQSMPSVIGLDDARKADAPVVFDKSSRKKAGNVSEGAGGPAPWKGNLRGPSAAFSQKAKKARNWTGAAREARDPLLVEATFRTATQQPSCLEPHAAVARFDGDRLPGHVATQGGVH